MEEGGHIITRVWGAVTEEDCSERTVHTNIKLFFADDDNKCQQYEIWEIIKIDCTCFQILDADIMISKEHPVRPLKKVRGLRLMLCSNALCKKYL